MTNKPCKKCKKIKLLSEFSIKSCTKDGLQPLCKECAKEYVISWREKNSNYSVEYRINNLEKVKAQQAIVRARRKDKIKAYELKNKDKINLRKRNRERERMSGDPAFKCRKLISRAVREIFAIKNITKDKSIRCLSYSMLQLKEHLESKFESWMSWNNHGNYNVKLWDDNDESTWTWQIDHIVPQSMFNYSSMDDAAFKECWALENLRPYSAKQNILDGINRVRHINKIE